MSSTHRAELFTSVVSAVLVCLMLAMLVFVPSAEAAVALIAR
jgi:hypothetical protein